MKSVNFACVLCLVLFCCIAPSRTVAQTNNSTDDRDKTLQQLLTEVRELRLAGFQVQLLRSYAETRFLPGVTGFVARDRDEMRDIIRPGGPLDDFDRGRCRERAAQLYGRDRMVADYERVYAAAAGHASPHERLARIA